MHFCEESATEFDKVQHFSNVISEVNLEENYLSVYQFSVTESDRIEHEYFQKQQPSPIKFNVNEIQNISAETENQPSLV